MWLVQWAKTLSMRNDFGVPIRNFGKVSETIYRGALPGLRGYQALVERVGVRRVVSLIEHQTEADRRRALDAGLKEWYHVPFSDRAAPQPARVREWISLMRDAAHAGTVFTHCRGGRHRTGVLVAVYRVVDCGWTKAAAFEEMLRYGWYGALGHQPILDWFNHEFDPQDYR